MISVDKKSTKNTITTIPASNDENVSPNIQTKSTQLSSKEVKGEKCQDHNWKPVLFYCNCGKFLCVLCLKSHCHSNMNFCDIKTFYNNVLKEMEQRVINYNIQDNVIFLGVVTNTKEFY